MERHSNFELRAQPLQIRKTGITSKTLVRTTGLVAAAALVGGFVLASSVDTGFLILAAFGYLFATAWVLVASRLHATRQLAFDADFVERVDGPVPMVRINRRMLRVSELQHVGLYEIPREEHDAAPAGMLYLVFSTCVVMLGPIDTVELAQELAATLLQGLDLKRPPPVVGSQPAGWGPKSVGYVGVTSFLLGGAAVTWAALLFAPLLGLLVAVVVLAATYVVVRYILGASACRALVRTYKLKLEV